MCKILFISAISSTWHCCVTSIDNCTRIFCPSRRKKNAMFCDVVLNIQHPLFCTWERTWTLSQRERAPFARYQVQYTLLLRG